LVGFSRYRRLHLHVAARAERPSVAGQHDTADLGILGNSGEMCEQPGQHPTGQRIQPLWPVENENGNAILNRQQQFLAHAAAPFR
jgi:hypothetical protein